MAELSLWGRPTLSRTEDAREGTITEVASRSCNPRAALRVPSIAVVYAYTRQCESRGIALSGYVCGLLLTGLAATLASDLARAARCGVAHQFRVRARSTELASVTAVQCPINSTQIIGLPLP
jgi:hypothetical protein